MSKLNSSLGRGLDSLMEEAQTAETPVRGTSVGFRQMSVTDILVPAADAAKLSDNEIPPLLVDSVRDYGVLQPLLVRKAAQGYTLIDGRKRLAAANRCGLTAVPAIVMHVSPEDADGVRSAANWRPALPQQPVATARSFTQLDDDNTPSPRNGIKWVYVVTGVVLLLCLVADIHVRMKRSNANERSASDAAESQAQPGPLAEDQIAQPPAGARPQLAGDIPEPTNPEPLPLPPSADEVTTDSVAMRSPGEEITPTPPAAEDGISAAGEPGSQPPSAEAAAESTAASPAVTVADITADATDEQAATPTTPDTPVALAINAEGITTRTTDGGIQVVFNQPIFRFRTVMHDSAAKPLKAVAAQLGAVASELQITVVGHTDSDPMPPNAAYADNTALGLARAKTVVQFLLNECGIPRTSVKAASWGEATPPYPNTSYDSRVRNRTVSLLIEPKREAT